MLQFKADGRIGEIVINRPDAGNAFTGEMARQLGEIMREVAQSADVITIHVPSPYSWPVVASSQAWSTAKPTTLATTLPKIQSTFMTSKQPSCT